MKMTKYDKIKNSSIRELATMILDVCHHDVCHFCSYIANCNAVSNSDCINGIIGYLNKEVDI